ncbi:MAG: hypothetical protein ACOCX4_02805 [Planctomycetota bacterium]
MLDRTPQDDRLPPCSRPIAEALRLSDALLDLARSGDAHAADDDCLQLYSIVLDCGYRIRRAAERERDGHRARGLWVDPDGGAEPGREQGRAS